MPFETAAERAAREARALRSSSSPTFANTTASGTQAANQTLEIVEVVDASGTNLLRNGERYAVLFRMPANQWTIAAGGKSHKLKFDRETVLLSGVKRADGKLAKPYFWDAARFRSVAQVAGGQVGTAVCTPNKVRS